LIYLVQTPSRIIIHVSPPQNTVKRPSGSGNAVDTVEGDEQHDLMKKSGVLQMAIVSFSEDRLDEAVEVDMQSIFGFERLAPFP
jgi:hypothetical protein